MINNYLMVEKRLRSRSRDESDRDSDFEAEVEESINFNSKSKTWYYLSNFYGGVEENFAAMRFPILKPLLEEI